MIFALTLAARAIPVLADGGLPQLASFHAGPFTAGLYDNAPTLVTGANTLTVQVPGLPDHHAVNLSLAGPHGQRLDVPLRPVQVLDGPPDMHAMPGMAEGPTTAPSGHFDQSSTQTMASMGDMPGMNHGISVAPSADAIATPPSTPGGETYVARGSIDVPEAGTWQARLIIHKAGGESFVGEAPLLAQDGGPNTLYVAAAGGLIGGFVLYGVIQRHRRRAPKPAETR